jgi:hypothetical protein
MRLLEGQRIIGRFLARLPLLVPLPNLFDLAHPLAFLALRAAGRLCSQCGTICDQLSPMAILVTVLPEIPNDAAMSTVLIDLSSYMLRNWRTAASVSLALALAVPRFDKPYQ